MHEVWGSIREFRTLAIVKNYLNLTIIAPLNPRSLVLHEDTFFLLEYEDSTFLLETSETVYGLTPIFCPLQFGSSLQRERARPRRSASPFSRSCARARGRAALPPHQHFRARIPGAGSGMRPGALCSSRPQLRPAAATARPRLCSRLCGYLALRAARTVSPRGCRAKPPAQGFRMQGAGVRPCV